MTFLYFLMSFNSEKSDCTIIYYRLPTFVSLLRFVWKFYDLTQFLHRKNKTKQNKRKHFLGTHNHKFVGEKRSKQCLSIPAHFSLPNFLCTGIHKRKVEMQKLASRTKKHMIWQAWNISFTTKQETQKLLFNFFFCKAIIDSSCIFSLMTKCLMLSIWTTAFNLREKNCFLK